MLLKRFFLEQLEREAIASRKVVERVPEGQNTWKPHERSMELGYLTSLRWRTEPSRAPSWTTDRVPAPERSQGAGDLWSQRRRVALAPAPQPKTQSPGAREVPGSFTVSVSPSDNHSSSSIE